MSHVKGVSQKDAATLMLGSETKDTVSETPNTYLLAQLAQNRTLIIGKSIC